MMTLDFYKYDSPTGLAARQRAPALPAAAQRTVEIALEDTGPARPPILDRIEVCSPVHRPGSG